MWQPAGIPYLLYCFRTPYLPYLLYCLMKYMMEGSVTACCATPSPAAPCRCGVGARHECGVMGRHVADGKAGWSAS